MSTIPCPESSSPQRDAGGTQARGQSGGMPPPTRAPPPSSSARSEHVDPVSATVWVETDRPCEVEVLGRRARRSASAGTTTHSSWSRTSSRAAAPLPSCTDGGRLAAGRVGVPAEPQPHRRRSGAFRIAFVPAGTPVPGRVGSPRGSRRRCGSVRQPDRHPAGGPVARRPGPAGDQVYADELTKETKSVLSRLRKRHEAPGGTRGRGRGLRGVHPALHGVVGDPQVPLAAVDDPVVHDLLRPRDDRRLKPRRRGGTM